LKAENLTNKELYKTFWKHDLVAAISVALVAMPLGLGIAIASGSPPISGIIAAIVGGFVATFIRSSHVAINGPGAGIIVVILTGNELLGDGGLSGFPYVLAAIFVAGVLQMLIGLFKLGRLGELVPNSVVEGMLAAIGIIIFAKQAHIGLGHISTADSAMGSLLEIPKSLFQLDPRIAVITIISLGIMIIYPKVRNKLFHFLPAPVWVLIFAIPYVLLYQYIVGDVMDITDPNITFPLSQLIDLPDDLILGLESPNFDKLGSASFWLVVFSVMFVASIETLISLKAIDNLDPLQRKTDLNKDMIAVGFSTSISALIGGLPVMAVIVRSSVNVANNAKTRLSNLFHGAVLLILVIALKPIVEEIPLACLAAILIYTGFRLAAPKQFVDAYEKGEEQLLEMAFTVLAVLIYGLLWGVALGISMAFLVQWIKSRMTIRSFLLAIWKPRLSGQQLDDKYEIKLGGVFTFVNLLKTKAAMKKLPMNERVVINFQEAILIDHTTMAYLGEYGKNYQSKGGNWTVRGLGNHESTSSHPYSMRMLQPQYQLSPRWMTEHQREMMKLSAHYGWQFVIGKEFQTSNLNVFPVFRSHPVEYIHNTITGLLPDLNLYFVMQDVVFDEGAWMGKIVYDTTVITIDLNQKLPEFVLEKEELFDKILQRAGFGDIDFEEDKEFSDKALLRASDVGAARDLFHSELRSFVVLNSDYHVECTGGKLLVFNKTSHLKVQEMQAMMRYSIDLIQLLIKK